MQAFPQQQRGHPFQNSLPGVAPLLLRKGLHLPGREALSERKTGFLSGLTLVVACLRSASLLNSVSSVSAPEVASLLNSCSLPLVARVQLWSNHPPGRAPNHYNLTRQRKKTPDRTLALKTQFLDPSKSFPQSKMVLTLEMSR